MAGEKIRPRNVAILAKIETVSGTEEAPATTDAITFEADGYSYNAPYRSEQSNEANGSLAAGAPLVIGQPIELSIRFRIKGAGAGTTYDATTKPPHHVLYSACGWRGVFTAAVSAAALTAGTTTSGTLGTGFGSTDQAYRGMPLQLSGGETRLVHVSDYDGGSKVATLADIFSGALSTGESAALPANWTYAPTSPADATARAADHPSATFYLYEDGVLHKFIGMRGTLALQGQTARPGFATATLRGIYGGKSDVAVPAVTVPQHAAPTFNMGGGGITPALVVNHEELAASQWSLSTNAELENPDDPNTQFGFGTGEIAGRRHVLALDPIATLVANRDVVSQIENGSQYPAILRFGSQGASNAGNRVSLMLPLSAPQDLAPGTRGIFRTEELQLAALNSGKGPDTRDSDTILCFY